MARLSSMGTVSAQPRGRTIIGRINLGDAPSDRAPCSPTMSINRTANRVSAGRCPNDVRGFAFEQRSHSQTSHARTNADTSPRMRGHQKRCVMRRNFDSKPWCPGKWKELRSLSRNKGGTTMHDKWQPLLTWRNKPLLTTRMCQTSKYCFRRS